MKRKTREDKEDIPYGPYTTRGRPPGLLVLGSLWGQAFSEVGTCAQGAGDSKVKSPLCFPTMNDVHSYSSSLSPRFPRLLDWKNKYQQVKQNLLGSSNCSCIVENKNGPQEIIHFLRKSITNPSIPSIAFVLGPTGSGKTHFLRCDCFKERIREFCKSPFKLSYINCYKITTLKQLYLAILKDFPGYQCPRGRGNKGQLMNDITRLLCDRDHPLIIVLDDVASIKERDFLQFFNLTTSPTSRAIIIAVGSTIDKSLDTNLNPRPQIIQFGTYSKTQIYSIIQQLVNSDFPVFDESAIEYVASKTYMNGNMRYALQVCLSALEKRWMEIAKKGENRPIKAHTNQTICNDTNSYHTNIHSYNINTNPTNHNKNTNSSTIMPNSTNKSFKKERKKPKKKDLQKSKKERPKLGRFRCNGETNDIIQHQNGICLIKDKRGKLDDEDDKGLQIKLEKTGVNTNGHRNSPFKLKNDQKEEMEIEIEIEDDGDQHHQTEAPPKSRRELLGISREDINRISLLGENFGTVKIDRIWIEIRDVHSIIAEKEKNDIECLPICQKFLLFAILQVTKEKNSNLVPLGEIWVKFQFLLNSNKALKAKENYLTATKISYMEFLSLLDFLSETSIISLDKSSISSTHIQVQFSPTYISQRLAQFSKELLIESE